MWAFIERNPSVLDHHSTIEIVELAMAVEEKCKKREENGKQSANNNGTKREENATPRHDEYKVGPGKPPIEHQFKKGNPGGPGRPKGARTMRSLIKQLLHAPNQPFDYPVQIAKSLLIEAVAGNTQAIRLVCENTNNKRNKR
jgi:hypothetical protein